MVNYFGAGEIQHILVSAMRQRASRSLNQPVRMSAIEIAVHIGHLKLYPQAEFHAQSFNLFRQPLDAVWQAFGVGVPVTQSGIIIVAGAEPTVIQHKQFHAVCLGSSGNFYELVLIKIKVGGFPVV